MINDSIVTIANGYLGQREDPTETSDNEKMADALYQAKLVAVGWVPGEEWCAAAAGVVWEQAYAPYPDLLAQVKKNFSLMSVTMALEFIADACWITSTTTPTVGALALFRDFEGSKHGHTGIVTKILPNNTYQTIEGNVSNAVAYRQHVVGELEQAPGIGAGKTRFLMCFVYPTEPPTALS